MSGVGHWCMSELGRGDSRHWGVAGEGRLATAVGKVAMHVDVVLFELMRGFETRLVTSSQHSKLSWHGLK